MIRVLLVEDSSTMRHHLRQSLAADPELEVVGEALDGGAAVEMVGLLRPDVVTMDMMLPTMSGLVATEHIMAEHPVPILVVSSADRQELFSTYNALAAGAVDVLEKPTGTEADGVWEERFLAIVKLVSRIRVIMHPRLRLADHAGSKAPAAAPPCHGRTDRKFELVAIGASTGGPGAIVEILRALPASFRLPIVFVLHINEPFGTAFADWLDGQAGRPVACAREGDPVASASGRVIMAPAGRPWTCCSSRSPGTTAHPPSRACLPAWDETVRPACCGCGRSAG
jgi:two-component system chemotaxis response regulator CheB